MKELTVEAEVCNIETVTDFINSELDNIDCPMKTRMQIDVAIDEMFGNIAHYAYESGKGKATVRIEFEKNPPAVIITFIDSGKPFNPLTIAEPDTTLSADERQIGGLGIFIVKKTMDSIVYNYTNGQNVLSIKKVLG